MAGTAHITHGLTRWSGKPTSGRFVYKSRLMGGWFWQCDLHDEPEAQPDQYGDVVPTMQEAFAGALTHAKACTANHSDRSDGFGGMMPAEAREIPSSVVSLDSRGLPTQPTEREPS